MGGVVVDHRLDQLAGRHVAFDRIEEADDLLVPVVTCPVSSDHG